MVGMEGFEPPASCSQGKRASQTALHPAKSYKQNYNLLGKTRQVLTVALRTKKCPACAGRGEIELTKAEYPYYVLFKSKLYKNFLYLLQAGII